MAFLAGAWLKSLRERTVRAAERSGLRAGLPGAAMLSKGVDVCGKCREARRLQHRKTQDNVSREECGH